MSEFPTPEHVERYLAAERAIRLGNEVIDILDVGGSHESVELASELTQVVALSTRKALTGQAEGGMISTQEMIAEKDRWIAEGNNPYPRLTMSESAELQNLLRRGSRTPYDQGRRDYLQYKALGRR
jgi:hypothetical protein